VPISIVLIGEVLVESINQRRQDSVDNIEGETQ
jgi:hypothetical protein